MVSNVGDALLRKENIDATVQGFALQEYKIKNVLTISPSSSWKETYYTETAADLTGGTGSNIKGIPRLASFPYGQVTWSKLSSTIEKYGMEGFISYEDAITDDLDVVARELLRITRAVVKSVEDTIYGVLASSYNGGGTITNIQTIAAAAPWNLANTQSGLSGGYVFRDISAAVRKIEQKNYDMDNGGAILVNPVGYESIMNDIYRAGASAPQISTGVLGGRTVTIIAGLAIIRSNSVTISGALVLKMKDCATWKSVTPLTTDIFYEPAISWRIRAWELGVTQLKNPNAICLITNTEI